jgi:hypothetical protein
MGASPLFPLFMAIFFFGVVALNRNYAETIESQTFTVAETSLAASAFLRYRSAVVTYAQKNPGWTGQVPADWMTGQGISATTQALVNHQVFTNTAGRIAIVHADMRGQGYAVYAQAKGDAAIGLVINSQFQSFNRAPPAALPISVPDGDVISFAQVSN